MTRVLPVAALLLLLVCEGSARAQDGPHLGQFDCYGLERGMLAYAGRFRFMPSGEVEFGGRRGKVDYDGASQAFMFEAGFPFVRARYDETRDELKAYLAPGVKMAHAESGSVDCKRSVPGKTGPP